MDHQPSLGQGRVGVLFEQTPVEDRLRAVLVRLTSCRFGFRCPGSEYFLAFFTLVDFAFPFEVAAPFPFFVVFSFLMVFVLLIIIFSKIGLF